MMGTRWHTRRVLQEPPRCLSLKLKELQQNEHQRGRCQRSCFPGFSSAIGLQRALK